jgi:hypothetical protein
MKATPTPLPGALHPHINWDFIRLMPRRSELVGRHGGLPLSKGSN